MADVFLSYAHEDVQTAQQVAEALERCGWSVWWDRRIPTATRWQRVLEPELEQARCVVVLWSAHSVLSEWVMREAESAAARTVLVPARIEAVQIPRATSAIQGADLTSWTGNLDTPELTQFLQAVSDRILPTCKITFESLLAPAPESLKVAIQTFTRVARRISADEGLKEDFTEEYIGSTGGTWRKRVERLISSVQAVINWHETLSDHFDVISDRDKLHAILARIERRLPLLWLNLLTYSGPYQHYGPALRTHRNYLACASLYLYRLTVSEARRSGIHIDVPEPLTEEMLSAPDWQPLIPAIFDDTDELAWAYVDRLDPLHYDLGQEVIVYGPRRLSMASYERMFNPDVLRYPEPRWFEQYFVPQFELLLAQNNPNRLVSYSGYAHIRKVTDHEGNDL
jgi:TIR domain